MFLRMVARPLMAKVKETTGIVGLEVVPNAREVLISLYGKTLKEIQAVPEDEGYRKAVESFTRHRLKVCQEEDDWEIIEKRLACGQVEELIEEAQDELKLIAKMIGTYISILSLSLSLTLLNSILIFTLFLCLFSFLEQCRVIRRIRRKI
ncbi:probable NADH dehydrogenase [ubiquinone] 1 alpha subcomplex subunit 5, mitochondrial [Camellia sinensis]|uniref:probable NADH dehydrogenase [ubiquinone] 1 alpha subcomplex subunit 5, mitochondrial n=1 Tax=Camellia sinensis TaxID=4442 RepID=UPI001036A9A0|nr:probable NADH dehydrogenase [ubiquinone] 1 alpha subcomplex subunit 5, mitochondrial [Camellia sinensis]